jgi:hypothetical protein
VNLDVLNRYVLGVIAVFALCLYFATVATGFNELRSRLRKVGSRKRRSGNHTSARRSRNPKRLPRP